MLRIDLTGQTINGRFVFAPGRRTANRTRRWRCRCTLCGYESEVVRYVLKTQGCKRCANRAKEKWTATTEEGQAHAASLTHQKWPRVCLTCGADFIGTARQKYCCIEHRPSTERKY